jgi:hypothetical protein
MQFFKKSNKNTTTSAAATPAQTPRGSVDEARPSTSGLTVKQQKDAKQVEHIHSMINKAIAGAPNGPYIL